MKHRLSLKARALQLLAQREHSRTELRRKLLRHAQADCRARMETVRPSAPVQQRAGQRLGAAALADEVISRKAARMSDARGDPAAGVTAEASAELPAEQPADVAAKLSAMPDGHEAIGLTDRPRSGRAAQHDVEPALDSGLEPEDVGPCLDKLLDWLEAHSYLSQERFVESRVHARGQRFGNLRIRQELAQHGAVLDEATQRSLRDTELDRARAVWQRKFGEATQDAAERARQMRFLAGRGFSPEVIRRVVQGRDD